MYLPKTNLMRINANILIVKLQFRFVLAKYSFVIAGAEKAKVLKALVDRAAIVVQENIGRV